MFKYRTSIRQKIVVGYYAAVAVIIAITVFTFFTLMFLEKKILFSTVITELFDTTLEIRRFEKNFFLYEKPEDYDENIRYVIKAQQILDSNIEKYESLTVYNQLYALRDSLKSYKLLMEHFSDPDKKSATEKRASENAIREKGKEIITIAEDISAIERERLLGLLREAGRYLIYVIAFLSLAGIAIGQILSKIVVKPLKSLEEAMKSIADGKFQTVSINSNDQEIVSLADAFGKMLKELETRRKSLLQSEKLASLGTLLSGVAHELNNPLSNISTSCQILSEEMDELDPDYRRELLSQIEDQSDRAKNIVRSLLEFSRAKDFKREDLSLVDLVLETIRFIKGQVPPLVEIRTDIPSSIRIFADKQRLQQVLLNLIKNAVEALENEGKIEITARRTSGEKPEEFNFSLSEECAGMLPRSENGDAVYIKITDTGKGIPADILGKIFDPFFTTKDVGKGSGLGLSIVYEIIEEHGGCIGAHSEVNKGTTFLIRLPVPQQSELDRTAKKKVTQDGGKA
ncbi:MAG TPA: HAMP domain-containing sensor histidine kinase [Dissulfurispiraceae bacterium]|nr:HAMP domain-containing sensor histidine kinase [Dissulfurispiraceae bacterium]